MGYQGGLKSLKVFYLHNSPNNSKSVDGQPSVGSNPTRSAIGTTESDRRSPFLFCGCRLALEHPAHRCRGLLLGGEVQVGIDVGGGGEGAVAQPDLNLFHGDAVAQQEAGAGVTKIC